MIIKNTRSIAFKILLMIFIITVLEAFLLISMSYYMSQNTMSDIIDKSSKSNVYTYSTLVGNWFDERINEVDIYAHYPLIRSMDWSKIEAYLKEQLKDKSSVYDLFIIAEVNGSYNATNKIGSSNISDKAYFQQAVNGKKLVSNPTFSAVDNSLVSVVAVPIRNEKDEIIGVLGAYASLAKLSNYVTAFRVNSESSYSYIVDKDGQIIIHSDKSLIMKQNITKPSELISPHMADVGIKIINNSNGNIKCTINNTTYMTYYSTIPNTDNWKLITNIPEEYTKAPVKDISIKLVALGIIGVLTGIALGIMISKSISKPIVNLKNTFKDAAAGDLTVRSEVSTLDEIGEASESFNKMMDTISHLIYYDALTDLPNRLMFYDRLEAEMLKALKDENKLCIMLIDIDKFEKINNTYGYSIGDKLLRQVAESIQQHVSQNDIVCRISDDKFAVLLIDSVQESNILRLAQNLTDMIKTPWDVEHHKFYITASTGIVFYPNDGDDAKTLIKNVYAAMLKAKNHGRDNYQLFDPAIGTRAQDTLILDNSIHNALKNDEFELYYQPQVDILSGSIVGAEALLRWKHPQLGMVSPDRFIPLIEENGLIIPIGEWVLRTACNQNKSWQSSGLKPIKMSVNISAVQLRQENFVDCVSRILEETQLDPEYLELEITESAAMENTKSMAVILERLRSMKISIAIDDFGTGYSSLNYLKSFEITTLKIDQSFIRDLLIDSKGAAIVSTILAIGHNLNLSVTAEGVETCEQLDFLKEKHCDIIQGYLYSRPVPKISFENLLRCDI